MIILLMVISSPNISKLSGGQLIHLLEPAMISLSQRFILSPFLSMHGNDSNLLIVFYVQIMPDDLVMQLHRF